MSNTIWADSNSAKNSFVNYIWSRLVFPLGAIVLPLSKLFIASVPRGTGWGWGSYSASTFACAEPYQKTWTVRWQIKVSPIIAHVIYIEYKYSGVNKAVKYCSTLCVGRTLYVDQPRWCQPPPPLNMLCGVTIVCRERGRAPICIQISNEYLYDSNKYSKIFHIVSIFFVLNIQEIRVGLTPRKSWLVLAFW